MTKAEIVAALRKAVPGQADFGKVNQKRINDYNGKVMARLVDVILEPEYDRYVCALADNVRLGIEEW